MKTQSQQPAHTKGEWNAELIASSGNRPVYWNITQGEGKTRLTINVYQGDKETIQEAEANAQRIVKAVNMHDELVKQLKNLYALSLKIAKIAGGDDLKNEEIEKLLKQAEQK